MRCKSTVNVVIKLPPNEAPSVPLRAELATNFYLTTVLQVEWGWVRVGFADLWRFADYCAKNQGVHKETNAK